MARTLITPTLIPADGYDFSGSSDYVTLGTGADNGIEFNYGENLTIFLKHASAAVYTVIVSKDTKYTAANVTITDKTFNVGAGEEWIIKPSGVFNDGGRMKIDCDVAGTVLVLSNA